MINLIPPSAKKSTLIEYWMRVVTAWFILFSIVLIAGAGILLPTYVLISSQVGVYEESAAAASEKVANYENVSEQLVQASQQAKLIVDEMTLPVFSGYIDMFEQLQGEGIQIESIEMSRDGLAISPIIIDGTASDRQTLASFRERLLEKEEIILVDLPISNLAKDSNIQFSLTVTLAGGGNNTNDI